MPSLPLDKTITVGVHGTLTVVAYIGSGGQGEVYRVTLHPTGEAMALKWYTDPVVLSDSAFRQNLQHICDTPPPSEAFLWPHAITDTVDGAYGYIMPLRPEGYIDMGKYFCIDIYPDAYFRSWEAKLNAAIEICNALRLLHDNGFSYQDINEGSFLIHPVSGRVRICDNDNIVPDGVSSTVRGKVGYMAPEVIAGSMPNRASDRFSLAIVLYRIFAINHPFDGRLTTGAAHSCLTPAQQELIYGREALFCHDPSDSSNRPDPVVHPNSAFYWPMFTLHLQAAFCQALGRRAIMEPGERFSAAAWCRIMQRERARIVHCRTAVPDEPHDYMKERPEALPCPLCDCAANDEMWLVFDDGLEYRLTHGKALYFGSDVIPSGICRAMETPYGHALGLVNAGRQSWHMEAPSGQTFPVNPGDRLQLVPGTTIHFGQCMAQVSKAPLTYI